MRRAPASLMSALSLCAALCALSEAASQFEEVVGLRDELKSLRARASLGAPGRGEELQDKVLALADESVSRMDGLRRLWGSYASASGLAASRAERERHRAALQGADERLSNLIPALYAATTAEQKRRMGAALTVEGGDSLIKQSIDLRRFYAAAKDMEGSLFSFIADDERRFRGAQRRHARARAARLAASGAALLALTGAAYGVLRHKRAVQGSHRNAAPGSPGTAPLPDSAPRLIGSYRVERELGRGGMGLVYEALDLDLRRKVAVKLMREDLAGGREGLARFLAEARLVAKLSHPNIVKIHSVLQDRGSVYLVFELVAGRALSARLSGGARLPLDEARGILRQVAAALDYAHSERIIHRDLKPGNIMLDERGRALVMDFGLAHQARVSAAKLTRADAWGTLPYMAPEQELGEVSRESDIFSLGVCLYEMLTGRLPYDGPNYLAQKRERRFAPPSGVAPALPGVLDPVLARALEPEPKDRYHSAAELSAAVDAL